MSADLKQNAKVKPSHAKLDFPEGWFSPKNNLEKGYNLSFAGGLVLTLAALPVILSISILTGSEGWKSNENIEIKNAITMSLAVLLLLAATTLFILGGKKIKLGKTYINNFATVIMDFAQTRYGIELNNYQARTLLGLNDTNYRTVDVNLGNARVNIRLDNLIDGKDIRFFYSGTNKELELNSDATSSPKKKLDLTDHGIIHRLEVKSIKPIVLNVFTEIFSLMILGYMTVFIAIVTTLSLINGDVKGVPVPQIAVIEGVILVIASILAYILVVRNVSAKIKKSNEAYLAFLPVFTDFVKSNYDLALSENEARLLFIGNNLTVEKDDERINIRLSELPEAKDLRVLYENTDVELPLAQ